MSTSILMNVVNGFINIPHNFNATLQRPILVFHGLCEWWPKGQQLMQLWSRIDFDPFLLQHIAQVREELALRKRNLQFSSIYLMIAQLYLHQIFVNEKSLHGVASRWIVALGVSDDFQSLV